MLQLAIAKFASRVCRHRLIVVVVAGASSSRLEQRLAIVVAALGLATAISGGALVLRLIVLGEGDRTNALRRAGSRD